MAYRIEETWGIWSVFEWRAYVWSTNAFSNHKDSYDVGFVGRPGVRSNCYSTERRRDSTGNDHRSIWGCGCRRSDSRHRNPDWSGARCSDQRGRMLLVAQRDPSELQAIGAASSA